jgi:phage recombination protein Bet
METALITIDTENQEKMEIVKQTFCKGASDLQFKFFIELANQIGADPFRREIFMVPRWDNTTKSMAMTPQVSIDYLRKNAGKSPNYAGQGEAEFGPEVISNGCKHPEWAVVPIFNKKFSQPIRVKALWIEFVSTTKSGDANAMWKKFPTVMLAKCSESQGLRRAFPEEIGGLDIPEETEHGNNVDIRVVEHNAEVLMPKKEETVTKEMMEEICSLLSVLNKEEGEMLKWAGVATIDEIPLGKGKVLISSLKSQVPPPIEETAEEIFEAESEILDMPKPAPKKKATAKKADALPFD